MPSSFACRTLWKSYLFSCRTKLAKLLCLKCFGRICFVNFSFCHGVREFCCVRDSAYPTSRTTKLSPSFPHLTTLSSCGLSSILQQTGQSIVPSGPLGAICLLVQLAHLQRSQHGIPGDRMTSTWHSQSRWSCLLQFQVVHPLSMTVNGRNGNFV